MSIWPEIYPMNPEDQIGKHFRLAPAQAAALRRLSLHTIYDLLYHFPARYEPLGKETETSKLVPGSKVSLYGTLSKLKAKKLWKSRRPATEGWFEDALRFLQGRKTDRHMDHLRQERGSLQDYAD